MKNSAKTTLGFLLAAALILAALVSANLSTSKFIDDTRWLVHSMEVQGQIEKLSTLFATAQNNLRAHHMTEQTHYLGLYSQANEALEASLQSLKILAADNPLQVLKLEQITSLLNAKRDRWEKSFDLRRKGGFEVIVSRMKTEESKARDAELFAAIDAFRAEENRLLVSRLSTSERQGQISMMLVWSGGILGCVLLFLAGFVVYRDNCRREIAEAEVDRFFTLSLDMLCISGMDGFFKRLSPSYGETLGFSLEELYAKPILDFIHPEDIEKTNQEIQNQLAGKKVLSFENRFLCRDGTYKTLSWKSVPVGDKMYAVARDVTQQKVFEGELLAAREGAQRAAVAKSAFLANMSHEIRTPLNGVVGMTDLLARTELNREQKNFVTVIRSSASSLLKIVNEILDFSKIEAGRVQLEMATFSLAQLIESRISLVGVLAAEKGLKMQGFVDPRVPESLYGDSGKIGQVLLNLLNNAIKFTDSGIILVTADVISLTRTDCDLRISVRDSGIGMISEQVDRLFEPFVQADSSTERKYGGTGLGLFLCRRFVEVMGGKIGVESLPGQGAVFWFRVKLDVANEPAILPLRNKPEAEERVVDLNQMARRKAIQILVAEDNQINQVIILSMIEALGYSAKLANNGEEAVQLFAKSHFDIVLMDQHMPVMDGLTASAEIRKLEKKSDRRVPIIAFTATVIQEEQKATFRKLMDDFLIKPVTIDALEKMLESWEARLEPPTASL